MRKNSNPMIPKTLLTSERIGQNQLVWVIKQLVTILAHAIIQNNSV